MFKRQDFFDFLKGTPPRYRSIAYEEGLVYSSYGLLETMRLGGCTSSAILLEGRNRIGVITHFRPTRVDEHLEEIKRLTRVYSSLRSAQNIALFWDGTNRESRYNIHGNVHRLITGLKEIFKGSNIEEIPYRGFLDWYGLCVDTGMLILRI